MPTSLVLGLPAATAMRRDSSFAAASKGGAGAQLDVIIFWRRSAVGRRVRGQKWRSWLACLSPKSSSGLHLYPTGFTYFEILDVTFGRERSFEPPARHQQVEGGSAGGEKHFYGPPRGLIGVLASHFYALLPGFGVWFSFTHQLSFWPPRTRDLHTQNRVTIP